MKVLFVNRNINSWHGGDVIKMFTFKKELERLGCEIDFTSDFKKDFSNYDIIHSFNLTYPWTWQAYQKAKQADKPLVVSSIFFPVNDKKITREVLEYAYIIAFSDEEVQAITEWTGINPHYRIIENGVSEMFFSNNQRRDIDVLCVGSWHTRKNQSAVVRATEELGLNMTAIGDTKYIINPESIEGFSHLTVIDHIPQEELPAYYSRAKVVVQASLTDPFPNTLLEAGIAGCNVVLTKNTFVPKDFPVFWCEPSDFTGIKKAIKKALKEKNNKLQELVVKNYSWTKKAEKIKDYYEYIKNRRAQTNGGENSPNSSSAPWNFTRTYYQV